MSDMNWEMRQAAITARHAARLPADVAAIHTADRERAIRAGQDAGYLDRSDVPGWVYDCDVLDAWREGRRKGLALRHRQQEEGTF